MVSRESNAVSPHPLKLNTVYLDLILPDELIILTCRSSDSSPAGARRKALHMRRTPHKRPETHT